jgi:HD-GYP domain-containing protein (c-di-GMP phosphodiesterase class II)
MDASVNAVESRDPSTAGHSRRVSKLSVAIANHMNLIDQGVFENINFSINDLKVIKYAALLHDFGKIGITERILLKAKKLFDEELTLIEQRLELLKYTLFRYQDYREPEKILSEVNAFKEAIFKANEPGFMGDEIKHQLKRVAELEVECLDSTRIPLLHEKEYQKLLYSRGSLSNDEYEVMKSHVEHTYNFLNLIRWPKGLEKIPEIARYHHEKLDGSGYPTGIQGNEIPLESQIMGIADIFDALTSSDRPYKVRMPLDKAISILYQEAREGKINIDIVDLMVDNEIYKIILDQP